MRQRQWVAIAFAVLLAPLPARSENEDSMLLCPVLSRELAKEGGSSGEGARPLPRGLRGVRM